MQIMLIGFSLQVAIMAVSLGVSMPKIVAGFYCKAADLPAEMVIYRCAEHVRLQCRPGVDAWVL